jgi:hypothetical protein
MKRRLWIFVLLMIPLISFIAGCGGGSEGSGGSIGSQSTVSGVAAVGAPINGTVHLKDALGKEVSVATNTEGSFSFNLDGLKAPYILMIQGTTGGNNYSLYSLCTGPGIANLNPFANLAILNVAGSVDMATLYATPSAATLQAISDNLARSVTDIQTVLQPLLALYNATTVNPVSDAYIANHQGLDGLLDMVSVDISAGTVTVKNKATGMTIFTAQLGSILSGTMNVMNIPMPSVVTTTDTPPADGWGSQILIGTLLNHLSYNLYSPKVALNDSNTAVAVWEEESGNTSKIWANRYAMGSWGAPVQISAGLSGSKEPRVAIDSNGNAVVVWTEVAYDSNGIGIVSNTIWASCYAVNTGAWTAPVRISNAPSADFTFYAYEPNLALDSAGNAVVVWIQDGVWSSRYNGSNWSAPQMLSSGTRKCNVPQVAIDGYDNVFVVWPQDTNAYDPSQPAGNSIPNIWARVYSSTTGTWGAAGLIGKPDLAMNDGTERARIAVNASGDVLVAWQETKSGVSSIVSSRFDKNTFSWLAPVNVSVDSTSFKSWPAVAMDAAGNTFLAWQEYGTAYNGWMSKYDAVLKTWSTPELFETDTQGIGNHAIGIDANGNALFVWKNGSVRARRYTAASGWGATGTIVSGLSIPDFSLAVNSSGNAMIIIKNLTSAMTKFDWAPYAVYFKP